MMTSGASHKARMDQESTSATKKMTQRTRLAKSEPIQKQRTVTVLCFPTFTNPISILLTDSKRALKAGKIAGHVKGTSHQA